MKNSLVLRILISLFIFFSVSSLIAILIFKSEMEKFAATINLQAEYKQIEFDISSSLDLLTMLTIAFVVATIITAIISFCIVTKKIRYICRLTEISKEVTNGNLDIPIQSDEKDELGDLARSFSKMLNSIKSITADLSSMAKTDALTQVANRHSFLMNGPSLFDFHIRLGKPVAILFFDIDDFKKINDTYGHSFGDDVLKNFATVVSETIRCSDLFCRYGGEEFVLLLSDADQNIGVLIGKRIIGFLQQSTFSQQSNFKYTTSIGLFSGIPKQNEKVEGYINKADQALYIAKKKGKNRIEVFRAKSAG